jgi:hypothetical protein
MSHAGSVGFADHYFWIDQVAQVVSESGMKALLGGASTRSGHSSLCRGIDWSS